MRVAVSPPRRVFAADSGSPFRANTIGSGFWACDPSSTMIRFRLLNACSAEASGPGGNTSVGWNSRSPEESTTCPNRPNWKCSVTYIVCGSRTSMPS